MTDSTPKKIAKKSPKKTSAMVKPASAEIVSAPVKAPARAPVKASVAKAPKPAKAARKVASVAAAASGPKVAVVPLQELMRQRAALDEQIRQQELAQRTAAIAQVREIISANGLTAEEVFSKRVKNAKDPKAGKAAPGVRGPKAGFTVPPKFRDPVSGGTWSGRGNRPVWLKTAIAGGAKLESFLIR